MRGSPFSSFSEADSPYRVLLESMVDGVFVAQDRRFVFANSALPAMLGYAHDEFLGLPFEAVVAPEFIEVWNERYRQRIGSGVEPPSHYEVKFLRRDGGEGIWVELRASRLHLQGQTAVLGIVRDVTERKAAEARLRQEQKMQSLGTLAGGIAHDFNNILGAILGNVELARHEASDQGATLARLEQIGSAGLRAKDLVRQILAFSHREPRALKTQPLRPLVDDALGLLRVTVPAAVRLESRLTDRALWVQAAETGVQQLVMNLCTNAWHALGGQPGRIEVGLDGVDIGDADLERLPGLAAGPHAHLWVGDSGCGMDDDTRARAFEPFFTTKPVGQGTGLGLAAVHGIVNELRGAITVDSAPGAGSCFHVYLPAQLEGSAATQTTTSRAPPRGSGERVLCVDDDPVMLLTIQGLLEHAGYRVSAVVDPQEALATLSAGTDPVDLLITDHNMPGLSGIELGRRVRRLRPDIPVIIGSGYLGAELRDAAQQAGLVVFNKEDSHAELAALVHRVLHPIGPRP